MHEVAVMLEAKGGVELHAHVGGGDLDCAAAVVAGFGDYTREQFFGDSFSTVLCNFHFIHLQMRLSDEAVVNVVNSIPDWRRICATLNVAGGRRLRAPGFVGGGGDERWRGCYNGCGIGFSREESAVGIMLSLKSREKSVFTD